MGGFHSPLHNLGGKTEFLQAYISIAVLSWGNNNFSKSTKQNACLLVSYCSGMDIFTTLLSLADIAAPADRRYDGVDATNILLHGEQTGREVVS